MDVVFEYKNGTIRISCSPENSFCQKESVLLISIEKENGYVIPKPYRLGIELKENHGGRICYGFISACIVPSIQRKISVTFEYEKGLDEDILIDSIYNTSTVGVGLPYEFRQDFEKYVISSLEMTEPFPWCNIVYDQFMHCKVGSSIKIYKIMISMMMKIVNDNPQQNIMNWNIKDFTRKYVQDSNLII